MGAREERRRRRRSKKEKGEEEEGFKRRKKEKSILKLYSYSYSYYLDASLLLTAEERFIGMNKKTERERAADAILV